MSEASEAFQERFKTALIDRLGHGKDGAVYLTETGQAVKFLDQPLLYHRELRAYHILRQRNIDEIDGFQIPRLLRHVDDLLAIEMTVVSPPFLLDFAASYSDEEYDRLGFAPDIVDEREAHWNEIFGENWLAVQSLRNDFHAITGLVLLDLSLNNIRFS